MRYDHLNGAHSCPKIAGGAKTVGHPVVPVSVFEALEAGREGDIV